MVLPAVQEMRAAGMSLRAIAGSLETKGFATVKGGQWTPAQVAAVLRRAGGKV
jgi:hypothetical protein